MAASIALLNSGTKLLDDGKAAVTSYSNPAFEAQAGTWIISQTLTLTGRSVLMILQGEFGQAQNDSYNLG